jgi:hypothetical protein
MGVGEREAMPTVVIPNGYAISRQHFTVTSKTDPAMIVLGLKPGTGTTAGNIATSARAAWATFVGSVQMPNSWTMVENVVNYVDAGVEFFGQASGSTAGTGTASATPAVAMLAKKITGLAGRKNHGRMYLYPPNESNVDQGGNLDSTFMTAVQTALNTLYSNLNGAGLGGIYLLHADGSTPTAVTSIQLEGRVATQRRRQR